MEEKEIDDLTSDTRSIELKLLTMDMYEEFKLVMIGAYQSMKDAFWKEEQIKKLTTIFPEGQVVIIVDGKIAGSALTITIDSQKYEDNHTYREITGNFTFDTHDPNGDKLYGIDVFVDRAFRGLRLGRRLYDYRKELCESLNLKAIVFGGRMPNYHKYSDELTPKKYIDKVKTKEIHDPVLDFQLSNDFHVRRILRNYLQGDKDSLDYAVLLQWENIFYVKPNVKVVQNKSNVRVGLVQWQMRSYKNIEELFEQVEFFVDAVSSYRCDFALFPEYFNAPLMAEYNHMSEPDAIRALSEFTEPMKKKFQEMAISYNINIITGSMPELTDGVLKNVGYLCKRDGEVEKYEKLHVTPDEAKIWGLTGGNTLKAFDTDCGKIGILICYDVEFPELGRLLSDQGMKMLFVPFMTDTQNSYSRVRNCAQARAIENECYVAIAGSIGNLPKVHNMDIQYAQSVVFTPCDYPFPFNGIKAEATPNTEMILVADVDLDLLKNLHEFGSVKNLKDRRTDLYELNLKIPK